jgi:hypothetical protein
VESSDFFELITFHKIDFLDKIWQKLDQGVDFMSDFPVSSPNYVLENVPTVCQGYHGVAEVCVTVDSWVPERILV